MAVQAPERTMARRNDSTVKIDAEVMRMAKIVAAYREMSLAEYLSGVLKPVVTEHLKEHSRRALEPGGKPKGKAPKGGEG